VDFSSMIYFPSESIKFEFFPKTTSFPSLSLENRFSTYFIEVVIRLVNRPSPITVGCN
jgi:hypothetical protein